jgi:hypothetical protein
MDLPNWALYTLFTVSVLLGVASIVKGVIALF